MVKADKVLTSFKKRSRSVFIKPFDHPQLGHC